MISLSRFLEFRIDCQKVNKTMHLIRLCNGTPVSSYDAIIIIKGSFKQFDAMLVLTVTTLVECSTEHVDFVNDHESLFRFLYPCV